MNVPGETVWVALALWFAFGYIGAAMLAGNINGTNDEPFGKNPYDRGTCAVATLFGLWGLVMVLALIFVSGTKQTIHSRTPLWQWPWGS